MVAESPRIGFACADARLWPPCGGAPLLRPAPLGSVTSVPSVYLCGSICHAEGAFSAY